MSTHKSCDYKLSAVKYYLSHSKNQAIDKFYLLEVYENLLDVENNIYHNIQDEHILFQVHY